MKIGLTDDFEIFKSGVCHQLKRYGDFEFIREIEESNDIEIAIDCGYEKEGLYLLAMVEYLCRVNDLPFAKKYDRFEALHLSEKIYPCGIVLLSMTSEPDAKQRAEKEAIPEFLKRNIVEGNIRNVC